METGSPDNVETVEPVVTDDQSVKQETTLEAPTLASIAWMHTEAHPGFDPAIHATNTDGTPKRKGDGSYALKRGRKVGGSNPLPAKGTGINSSSVTPEIAQTEAQTEAPKISPDEAARQSANLVINAAVWICGEEIGKPQDKAEADGLKISFVNYYGARGVPNIPPEIGLIAALASYIVPRFHQSEKARGFIERGVIWVRAKIGK